MALMKTQAAATRSTATTQRGTGAGEYTVKGKRATAKQRETIDGCLAEAARLKGSRRFLIAVVMTITQESVAGEEQGVTGNDDMGIYHQGRNWVSEEGAKDPAQATRAFAITGPTSWKKVHGGLKKVPGNLEDAIKRVQISVGGYGQWEEEATRTVDNWLNNGGSSEASEYIKRYSFTRGEKGGQRENSWDAAVRLVDEVGAYRWAWRNTFYAVSGDELRAATPQIQIRGDEAWLLRAPAWSWSAGRAMSEVNFPVLADRWDIDPGGCVLLHRRYGAMSGRWMVWNVSGASLDDPEALVVLRRPTKLKAEPASEVGQRSEDSGTGGELRAICKEISDNRSEYLYGGGHGPALKDLKSSSRMDCSSSSSLALYRAKMFDGTRAIVSGEFQKSWGEAGKGEEFTVWANPTHVWIEGYDESGEFAWRFDTSQHSGKSGPMLTTVPRNDHERFTARHYPGH